MSFFDIFKKKSDGGRAARGSRYYIIDASTLDSNKGERIRLTPRNQMDILRRLSRFVKKEKLEACVVFEGKPLRDAPDNKAYNEVLVRYATSTDKVIELVNAIDNANRGKNVLVITADKNVETFVMKQNGALMHTSTFRKALESNGSGKSERPSGNRRRQSRKSSGPSKNNNKSQGGQPPKKSAKPKTEKKEEDAVSELIDLV